MLEWIEEGVKSRRKRFLSAFYLLDINVSKMNKKE